MIYFLALIPATMLTVAGYGERGMYGPMPPNPAPAPGSAPEPR